MLWSREMVSRDMKTVMRRSKRPNTLLSKNTAARQSVNSKRNEMERVRQDINRQKRQGHTHVHAEAQKMNIDMIHKHKLFHGDDDAYAAYLLNNCVGEIRSMYMNDTDDALSETCSHPDTIEDTRGGCDVCVHCGNTTTRILFDTSGMDGILQGSSSVVSHHVYKRKTYFLSHLRNLFGQTRSRAVPWLIELWAMKQQRVQSGSDLLLAMKQAPKRVRNALRLARYYKHAHRLYRDTHRCGRRTMELRSDVEDRIMHMFDGSLTAFTMVREKHNRSSFLNKHYVMYQLMRLAHVDQSMLDIVPRMQMDCKNREHDHIWVDICDVMHWPAHFLSDHNECTDCRCGGANQR